MDSLNERLANLGQAVAEVNAPDQDAIADARRRWARSGRHTPGRRWTFVVVPAFAIAAAVIAIILTRTSEGERSLTYSIGDVPGERGQWIAAREPVRLRFSDGSHVEVARDAKMRVAATDQRGSTIDLEQGALHAEVVHRGVSSWHFRTGPYTVLVKGTRFDAAWDSMRETFTLDMLEGKVEITGPLIQAPVTVTAGQSVIANVPEKRFEIRSFRTAADASGAAKPGPDISKQDVTQAVLPSASSSIDPGAKPSALETATTTKPTPSRSKSTAKAVAEQPDPHSISTPAQEKAAQASQGSAAVANTAATMPSTKVEKWREYLAARAYSSAIKAAEQRGFDAVVAEATTAELYALSDAARYAGRLARARDALIALRARFNEQGKTAFLLGRIAADEKDVAGAIEWFDRYLQEQPGGPLAETATGRLIELYKPRDAARARKLAERYLAAYPDGSYAALAKTLVEK
jgi:hypothetical protein